jgi:hypothetical protein
VERWPRYLTEVGRCLRPGGVALLLEKRRATRAAFVGFLPPGLDLERFEDYESPLRDGRSKPFLEAVLVNRSPPH